MSRACTLMLLVGMVACSWQPQNMAARTDCRPVAAPATQALHLDKKLERTDAETALDVVLHLLPRNEARLDERIRNIFTKGHAQQGQFLSPEDYAKDHGPQAEEVGQVVDYLKSFGFGMFELVGNAIKARGQVGHAEKAFRTSIYNYTSHLGGFGYGPECDATVPRHLPRMVVDGLSHKSGKLMHLQAAAPQAAPHALDAKTIRTAYSVPGPSLGRGQSIAMLELDSYKPRDLDVYAKAMGIRRVPTRNVLVGGFDGRIVDQDARIEVTMDIELAMAMAPGLDEIVVYQAHNENNGLLDVLNRLANPIKGEKLIKIASLSWGEPERDMSAAEVTAEYNILRQLAAQGQTVFVASGDSGAFADGRRLGTDDPASQPYAMAVGGTTLKVVEGLWHKESAWSGGGGGISCFWKAPPWQAHCDAAKSKSSLTMRDVPDVALNANPKVGYAVYVNGWLTVGGTSCAAPLWAGFAALVDERRASLGKPALGFWPPILYSVAQTDAGRAGLHDISDNSNNGYYPAVDGIDDATGWGSLIGDKLLDALGAL